MYGTKICLFFDINFHRSQAPCNQFPYSIHFFLTFGYISSATFCGVGLKDGRVRDDDIAVSTTASSFYQKQFARLDRQGTDSQRGGWLSCGNPCGKLFSISTTVSFASMKIKVPTQTCLIEGFST